MKIQVIYRPSGEIIATSYNQTETYSDDVSGFGEALSLVAEGESAQDIFGGRPLARSQVVNGQIVERVETPEEVSAAAEADRLRTLKTSFAAMTKDDWMGLTAAVRWEMIYDLMKLGR